MLFNSTFVIYPKDLRAKREYLKNQNYSDPIESWYMYICNITGDDFKFKFKFKCSYLDINVCIRTNFIVSETINKII